VPRLKRENHTDHPVKSGRAATDLVDDPLSLEHQLCFAMYAASRAIMRTYRDRLEPLGISYTQYLVLIVLWEKNCRTISELGNRLRLDSGTLTPLLKRMEIAGFVERHRRQADEREVEVHLTSAGRSIKTAVAGAREHVVKRLGMSSAQIMALRQELMDVVEHLDRMGETTPDS